jgi:excisionase family DNA binding protein
MLDVREAAELAGRSPETIRRWVWSGRLRAVKQGNRLIVARRAVEGLAGTSPRASEVPTLADWAREASPSMGARTTATAADLVLAARRDRD